MECLPNKLTLLYSKIYYKEENYLKVKIKVFKYTTPPYSKGWVCWYVGILAYSIFLYFYVSIFQTLVMYCLCDLVTPCPIALLVPSVPHSAYWS